jgi:hypothetical protein
MSLSRARTVTLRVGALVACLLLAGPGCSSSSEEAPAAQARAPAYPRDGELRINHIQAKGTHNSYHVETPGNSESAWHYTMPPLDVQLDQLGVRQLELDVRLDKGDDHLQVYHLPLVDQNTTCRLFTDCLSIIKTWSDAHPGHHILYVQIEVKYPGASPDLEPFFLQIEREISSVWPADRVLTPDQVRGGAATLAEAVATTGWPTLGETRGKVMFGLDDTASYVQAYTRGGKSLDGRLMFAGSSPTDPYAAVAVINDPKAVDRIKAATMAGMLVRSQSVGADSSDGQGDIDAALASGATWLSTDYPAKAPESPVWFDLPTGTPSRCNPLTAPATCTPADLESPDRLR